MRHLWGGPGAASEILGAPWRIDRGWIYTWIDGRTDPRRVDSMLEVVTTVRLSLPAHLLADHGARAAADR